MLKLYGAVMLVFTPWGARFDSNVFLSDFFFFFLLLWVIDEQQTLIQEMI